MPEGAAQLVLTTFRRLLDHHGTQSWWPADSPFEVAIGAILTQSAAWTNVERALQNLKQAGVFSPQGLRAIPLEELAALIKPSGYFNAKARKVKAFVGHLGRHHDDNLRAMLRRDGDDLRRELLSIYGVGEETADDILLYAAHQPFFVVDAYTRRIFQRLGVAPPGRSYRHWQAMFHRVLPRDASLFNEYHALLVIHGKATCRKTPRCGECCLRDLCPTGQIETASGGRVDIHESTPKGPDD